MTAARVAGFSPRERIAVRRNLLKWYRSAARDLPWRRTREPYRIWLSEIMLQQTRVETVIEYYRRFLRAFPTVTSLANSDLDDVLKMWSGLGYYRRARNLHAAARLVADELNGRFPESVEGLGALPGVGRYTAGAIASIAFGRRAAVVDGNVQRVLARLFAIDDEISAPRTTALLWELAESLLPREAVGDFNQALMELGARVCTPTSPACGTCSLRRQCRALREDLVEALPVRGPRRAPVPVEALAAAIDKHGRFLLVQRPAEGLLGGLWQLPQEQFVVNGQPARALARSLQKTLGLRVCVGEKMGTIEHAFTHRALRLHVYRCSHESGAVRLTRHQASRWLRPSEFERCALSTLDRKTLALL